MRQRTYLFYSHVSPNIHCVFIHSPAPLLSLTTPTMIPGSLWVLITFPLISFQPLIKNDPIWVRTMLSRHSYSLPWSVVYCVNPVNLEPYILQVLLLTSRAHCMKFKQNKTKQNCSLWINSTHSKIKELWFSNCWLSNRFMKVYLRAQKPRIWLFVLFRLFCVLLSVGNMPQPLKPVLWNIPGYKEGKKTVNWSTASGVQHFNPIHNKWSTNIK